jgi:hypothetical protein
MERWNACFSVAAIVIVTKGKTEKLKTELARSNICEPRRRGEAGHPVVEKIVYLRLQIMRFVDLGLQTSTS